MLVAALHRADRNSLFSRGVAHGLQKVADDLVAVRRDADFSAEPDQIEDHPRPGIGLARPRWTLDRQRRAVELRREPARRLLPGFASARQGLSVALPDSRRSSSQQVA